MKKSISNKTKAQAATEVPFTEAELTRIRSIAHATWEGIGYEVLRAVEEYDGKTSMSRAEVIEVVTDADRLLDYARKPEDRDLVRRFYALDIARQDKILRPMFSYSRYSI